jgi:hypothetical protein
MQRNAIRGSLTFTTEAQRAQMFLLVWFCRVGFAHRFPGVYAFVLVGGAHPAKNMPE